MNKRSAQKNDSSNPVRPFCTTSVEMQKEDEEEEDSREDEDVQPVFCRKPPEVPTESEKRDHEVTHMPFRSRVQRVSKPERQIRRIRCKWTKSIDIQKFILIIVS